MAGRQSAPGSGDTVYLAVYDLSHGRLQTVAALLMQNAIKGVWHTGLRVHGWEYTYGRSILKMRFDEAETAVGAKPTALERLGKTRKTMPEIDAFMCSIYQKYSAKKYNILSHNCNHFTQEAVRFLVPSCPGLPKYVSALPQQLRSSALGRAVVAVYRTVADERQRERDAICGNPLACGVPHRRRAHSSENILADKQSNAAVYRGGRTGLSRASMPQERGHTYGMYRLPRPNLRRRHSPSRATNPRSEPLVPTANIWNFPATQAVARDAVPLFSHRLRTLTGEAPPPFVIPRTARLPAAAQITHAEQAPALSIGASYLTYPPPPPIAD